MITMCQLYNDFKGQANTWQQGHFRPLSFEYAVHESVLEIFNELRKQWEANQIVTDALRPYFQRVQVPIKELVQGGVVKYPDNYVSFSGLRYLNKRKNGGGAGILCSDLSILDKDKTCRKIREEDKVDMALTADQLYEHDITKVDSQRWGSVMEHGFIYPSVQNPYCTQDNEGFRVLPKGIGVVVLYYLASPVRAKFIYSKGANHSFLCTDASGQILFGDEVLPELMGRVKTKYASFVSNERKYAEGVKEVQNAGY